MPEQTPEQRVAALHAQCRADYGTPQERQDRQVAYAEQREHALIRAAESAHNLAGGQS